MKKLGLNEIREKYLSFFEGKDHLRHKSFSLVPENDDSILLVNAGMTPLKPYFTGQKTPPSLRMTTCQKCIRTPDIDRVGQTARHGTFFEMLGNFSFGDYFKKEAIAWAWEFCTEVLEMPADKLSATVYLEDDEAYDIWKDDIALPEDRIFRMGKEDNFWEHGTGPCGPCSEIFFDRGPEKGCGEPDCNVGCECDRFVEFWNLVFTQFDKQEDGSYLPLDKKNIDTGAGLERFAAIMQDVDNLFEVDTVANILDAVCKALGLEYGQDDEADIAIRIITDHARSTVMMISDGILPDNTGRGYVLRRLLRRASRYAKLHGKDEPFLHEIADQVIISYAGEYPELEEKKSTVKRVILNEEESFAKTLTQGTQILMDEIKAIEKAGSDKLLNGEILFRLHDTYGFPLELTKEIAAENGFESDDEAYHSIMEEQREKTRRIALEKKAGAAWSGGSIDSLLPFDTATVFTGYDKLKETSTLLAILKADGEGHLALVESAQAGDEVLLAVDKTPFYAESGGQVGDRGLILGDGLRIEVSDTTKTDGDIYLHSGLIKEGELKTGDSLDLQVDDELRLSTARNHTVTHMLHKALRRVLGSHVAQAGSEVSEDKLRFDFTHFGAMTTDEKDRVEAMVNEIILSNSDVSTEIMPLEEAKAKAVAALFDEKYGDLVRVVSVGDYSHELCGGTHLDNSSVAGRFRITSESAIASGVRRIEGVTGQKALELDKENNDLLRSTAQMLKINPADLPERVGAMSERIRTLEKKIDELMRENALGAVDDLLKDAGEYKGVKYVFRQVESENQNNLRGIADMLKDKFSGVILLASVHGDKLSFVCMAAKEAVEAGVHAGNIVRAAASAAGGGGGGRPDMAQAGGRDVSALDKALETAEDTFKQMLDK